MISKLVFYSCDSEEAKKIVWVQEEKCGSLSVQDAEQTQNKNICLVQLNELSYASKHVKRNAKFPTVRSSM